jgi:hypothetical protein
MSDEDEDKVFTVVATKTITGTFEVYADDEDDARFQVENPADSFTFGVTVSDAMNVTEDEWDVSTIEEKP